MKPYKCKICDGDLIVEMVAKYVYRVDAKGNRLQLPQKDTFVNAIFCAKNRDHDCGFYFDNGLIIEEVKA